MNTHTWIYAFGYSISQPMSSSSSSSLPCWAMSSAQVFSEDPVVDGPLASVSYRLQGRRAVQLFGYSFPVCCCAAQALYKARAHYPPSPLSLGLAGKTSVSRSLGKTSSSVKPFGANSVSYHCHIFTYTKTSSTHAQYGTEYGNVPLTSKFQMKQKP